MSTHKATNKKLRDRAVRVIQEVTGADEETARRFGSEAEGDVRVAILMLMFSISQAKAVDMLVLTHDHFGEAVKLLEQSRL